MGYEWGVSKLDQAWVTTEDSYLVEKKLFKTNLFFYFNRPDRLNLQWYSYIGFDWIRQVWCYYALIYIFWITIDLNVVHTWHNYYTLSVNLEWESSKNYSQTCI
jgi:hypothetical protein